MVARLSLRLPSLLEARPGYGGHPGGGRGTTTRVARVKSLGEIRGVRDIKHFANSREFGTREDLEESGCTRGGAELHPRSLRSSKS
jgi:hypothetical protein